MATKKASKAEARPKAKARRTPAAAVTPAARDRVYTLEVFLLSGPVTRKFAEKNRVVSRTILLRGDQTLEDLHHAIFDAFGRQEEHMYEFQIGGKGPMDPRARHYVLHGAFDLHREEGRPAAGRVEETAIDALGLKVGDRFGYWFDFGDDWWHQVNVEAVEEKTPRGKLPRVVKKVGKSPPQYAGLDEDE
jgi:hypothetical protein